MTSFESLHANVVIGCALLPLVVHYPHHRPNNDPLAVQEGSDTTIATAVILKAFQLTFLVSRNNSSAWRISSRNPSLLYRTAKSLYSF